MTRLEKITHILLISVCLVSIGLLTENRFFPPRGDHRFDKSLLGRRVDINGPNWSNSKLTLVMFISNKCHFCADSIPFYQKLYQTVHSGNASANVVVASNEPQDEMRAYLASNTIPFGDVYHTPQGVLGVSVTPVLLIVDQEGIVKKVFIGKLGSFDEWRVKHLLESGSI